jgi:hypothetical protein
VLEALLHQVESVMKEPSPSLRVVAYGESAVTYEIRYFVARYEDYRTAEGEVNRLIWYYFRRHGIDIPYPIRTVHLHNADVHEARDGVPGRLDRAIRNIDLFRPLSDDELKAAASAFRHLHYSAGERIIVEGAPGDSFFVIDRGEVEVSKTLAGKSRVLVQNPAIAVEISTILSERRDALSQAKDDITARFQTEDVMGDRSQKILGRIRSWFGL